MLHKKEIINTLFVISFPIYGLGCYVSATVSSSLGYIVSVIPYVLMMLFYGVDLLYRKEFRVKINALYLVMSLFLISAVASLVVSFNKGLPESTLQLLITKSLAGVLPFQAFVILYLYNEDQKSSVPKLTLISLSLLLFINLIGYFGLGLENETHYLEGRINLPFMAGLYNGASLLAIINIMLLFYMKDPLTSPIRFSVLSGYFVMNLAILFFINSRLVILVFAFVCLLLLFQLPKRVGNFFWASLFMLPILLSFGPLIHDILSLPVFASILKRVDLTDVTTLNGRTYLWEDAIDWIVNDRTGLLFGNGYKGHYFLRLLEDVAALWNEPQLDHMHLHSTSLEILIAQGVVGLLLFLTLFYYLSRYYQKQYRAGTPERVFMAVSIFLMFVMQADMFVYWDNLGFVIFSLLLAKVVLKEKEIPPVKKTPEKYVQMKRIVQRKREPIRAARAFA